MSGLSNSYLPLYTDPIANPALDYFILYSSVQQSLTLTGTPAVVLPFPNILEGNNFRQVSPGVVEYIGNSTNMFKLFYNVDVFSGIDPGQISLHLSINILGEEEPSAVSFISLVPDFVRETRGVSLTTLNPGDVLFLSVAIETSPPLTINVANVKLSCYELIT